ncbi:MAG: metallopeptidase family protein [Planctomycetota bacterium]|jgi:predicted Zn-dependent protease with MMP-like domain
MIAAERKRFDALLEQVLAELPPRLHELLEEAPLIVEDRPSAMLLEELGIDDDHDLLCGLHSGAPLTERSVADEGGLLEMIHLFREGIVEHAGGWEPFQEDDGAWHGGEEALRREIRITLLHEIGHHFGLEEDDLTELGYE